jgi:hypothetical protein
VLVLLQRLGEFAWAHSLWLLAEQVEQPMAGSGATDFSDAADHGPQGCGGIEVQGQWLLAFAIAPSHQVGCLCLSTFALQDERAIHPPVMPIELVISSSMSLELVLHR